MSDRPEEEARAAAVETRESPRPADVGGKVNAIIEAAEAAAKEIRQGASKEALEIVRQAEKEAAANTRKTTAPAISQRCSCRIRTRPAKSSARSRWSRSFQCKP